MAGKRYTILCWMCSYAGQSAMCARRSCRRCASTNKCSTSNVHKSRTRHCVRRYNERSFVAATFLFLVLMNLPHAALFGTDLCARQHHFMVLDFSSAFHSSIWPSLENKRFSTWWGFRWANISSFAQFFHTENSGPNPAGEDMWCHALHFNYYLVKISLCICLFFSVPEMKWIEHMCFDKLKWYLYGAHRVRSQKANVRGAVKLLFWWQLRRRRREWRGFLPVDP